MTVFGAFPSNISQCVKQIVILICLPSSVSILLGWPSKNTVAHLKCNLKHMIDTSLIHTCDSRPIRDGDVNVSRLDCDSEFEPHLKFLANRICYDNLRTSSVALGGYFDHVNKPSLLRHSSNVFNCAWRIFG